MESTCFGCEHKNSSGSTFCGSCGAPLALSSYVQREVDSRLSAATRDREAFEIESSVRIFEKAYGWAKLFGTIALGVGAVLLAGAAYESFDLRAKVHNSEAAVVAAKDSAQRSIRETADSYSFTVARESGSSVQAIRTAAKEAAASSREAQATAKAEGSSIRSQASQIRSDLSSQSAAVTKDVESARTQIHAASELQPQMSSLQAQLQTAQTQLQRQQDIITSSADFAKKIFSTHRQTLFDRSSAAPKSFAIISANLPKSLPGEALYLLLPEAPVYETLQIQFNQIVAAPNSYLQLDNLLIIFMQKNAEAELLAKPVSIGYFPDPDAKTLIHELTVKDDRVYADGEALPKIGNFPDPTFKGSRWFPDPSVFPQAPASSPRQAAPTAPK